MGSKHTYITKDEWGEVKRAIESIAKEGKTMRDVAYWSNRSDQAIRQIADTISYAEYRSKYQGKRYPQTLLRTPTHSQALPISFQERLNEIDKRLSRIEDERLSRIEEQLRAMNYIWEK